MTISNWPINFSLLLLHDTFSCIADTISSSFLSLNKPNTQIQINITVDPGETSFAAEQSRILLQLRRL
ncbi:unnamed protein product [Thlaspi arvense]|uniref:Secreted protein n=1 Tax=Thlaspi arvense TaxID=13288 RepID=A0AAU9SCF7_THLAR|nr:unnamed protein product [Thlaspi arvense]